MSNTLHIFDFLGSDRVAAVNVLFGEERFLRVLARRRIQDLVVGDASDGEVSRFEGPTVEWKDVHDELATLSLFGADEARLVYVETADPFVTKFRDRLEQYLQKPSNRGILVLEVDRWQKNTRLFKLIDGTGLQVECRPPTKGKTVDEKKIKSWLTEWARSVHHRRLAPQAATRMVELIGPNFGLFDQELAKLALFTDEKTTIGAEMVEESVRGWRGKTVWEMVDAAADGKADAALSQLDQLLLAGEHPMGLFGQMSWSLRRYATATRIYEYEESQRRRPRLSDVLVKAGFPHWNRQALARAEQQLKRIGRRRAGDIHHWLMEADLALKGSHSSTERARLVLERLLVEIARP